MFIPLGDDNTHRRRSPLVVIGLIVACSIVWLLQLEGGDSFTAAYSAIPVEILQNKDLVTPTIVDFGGQRVSIPQAPGPSLIWLTLISAMFMHGSWLHIIGNMVYLYIFGDQIEDALGHLQFLFFYIICGIIASLAHVLSDPSSVLPSLGASGAIAGVLGAYLVLHPQNRVKVLVLRNVVDLPALVVLGGWFALQFFGQFGAEGGGGVAYLAHIGGFIAGIILLLPFHGWPSRAARKKTSPRRAL